MVFHKSSHTLPHGTVVLGGTILHYIDTNSMYGTTQMQLHTCACVLVCQHACVNMLPITCDGVLRSLTCYTHVLHEGLHTHMCYLSRYKLATTCYSHVRVTYVYNMAGAYGAAGMAMATPLLSLHGNALMLLYKSEKNNHNF